MQTIIKFLIGMILFLVIIPREVNANEESSSFITIVNPVRISSYTPNPSVSLKSEYDEIKKRGFGATWLLTYDVLSDDSMISVISSMDENQELGIFLEVTQMFCSDSQVFYNKTDGWQRATSVFLSGYSQDDRKKLIDKVFLKFKDKFGYFPKSVGGWWVDSFSLSYMKYKFGITGVLGMSDQYDLDGYQLWGTPWSTPFYPSKFHAGIPAGNIDDKLDIVTFRWAERDPLNGYLTPGKKQASLYSVQDYPSVGEYDEYLEKLIDLYAVKKDYNSYGHLTIGLEADYSKDVYESIYAKRMDLIKEFSENNVNIVTMEDFSKFYQTAFPDLSSIHTIEAKDLLGTNKHSFWVQSNSYRIGLIYDYDSRKLKVVDFRIYQNNFQEPNYISPNKDLELSINLPFVIDALIEGRSLFDLELGEVKAINRNKDIIELIFENDSILFKENEIVIPKKITLPPNIKNSKFLVLKNSKDRIFIIPEKNFYIPKEGMIIKDFSLRVPFALKIRIERYLLFLIIVSLLGSVLLFKFRQKIQKHYSLLLIIIVFLAVVYVFIKANAKYYISQDEMFGLSVLSGLPEGKVLVYDKDCIKCRFKTRLKPASSAGIKSYVSRFSNTEVLIDYSFMTAKDSLTSRKILSERNIKYVYLTKYEDYIEALPYLPQDLGLKKVYENANSEIWKVK